jgi:hypothetical protein
VTAKQHKPDRDLRIGEIASHRDTASDPGLTCPADRDPAEREARVAGLERAYAPIVEAMRRAGKTPSMRTKAKLSEAMKRRRNSVSKPVQTPVEKPLTGVAAFNAWRARERQRQAVKP